MLNDFTQRRSPGLRGLFRVAGAYIQVSHAPQQISFVFAEAIPKVVRVHDLGTLLRGHAPQPTVLLRDLGTTVFRQPMISLEQVLGGHLLLRRHMFVSLHPVQDLLLLLRRLAIELAQTVEQVLLPIRRKTVERWVLSQLLLLLAGGQAEVLPQPIPFMRAGSV